MPKMLATAVNGRKITETMANVNEADSCMSLVVSSKRKCYDLLAILKEC